MEKEKRLTGVVCVSSDDHPLRDARRGETVELASPPPWIVVDHVIETTITTRWPARLWLVEILDFPAEAQLTSSYTRAAAIRVLDELPPGRLFGPHGDAVCEVLDVAAALELSDVERLARLPRSAASQVYDSVWQAWAEEVDPKTGRRRTGSPINGGFLLLGTVVNLRAREIVGDDAFTMGDDHYVLIPPWSDAGNALVYAALAVGRPDLLSVEDLKLLEPFKLAVLGPDPTRRG